MPRLPRVDVSNGLFEIPHDTALPATCQVGELFHDDDGVAGARLYLCTAVNTWTAVDMAAWRAIPLMQWALSATFQSINYSPDELAWVDTSSA